ncbi:MAG: hypothetical protein KH544_02730 [Firmicutes bacterium]|nr:hypothetical protein [Bacillota bacterium]
MKIGMNEILRGIEYTAIQKITKELERDGFSINKEYSIFDLYAEKGDDKRIYEFKIGKNRIQKRQFIALQEEAKRLGAKLYIVYLEIPRSKEVDFEGLDQIIYEDLLNDFPSEIDALSTHTTIESIEDIEIDSINISDSIVKLTGSGTINVHLQFGSRSDLKNNDAVEDVGSVDFFFKLSVDVANNEVIKRYYKIDIE